MWNSVSIDYKGSGGHFTIQVRIFFSDHPGSFESESMEYTPSLYLITIDTGSLWPGVKLLGCEHYAMSFRCNRRCFLGGVLQNGMRWRVL